MAGELRSIAVEIAGRVYHVKTKESELYVQNLAKIVNEQMAEITESTNMVDSLRVIDMTALNLADLYCKTKARLEQRVNTLEQERDHLREKIEQALEQVDSLPDT